MINQHSQAKALLLENKSRGEKQYQQYLDREEILSQVEITNFSIDEFFDGRSYSSSPEKSPEIESLAEIIDIKGSNKSDTAFIKGRELAEKGLLETLAKNALERTAQRMFYKNVIKAMVTQNLSSKIRIFRCMKIPYRTTHNSKAKYFKSRAAF